METKAKATRDAEQGDATPGIWIKDAPGSYFLFFLHPFILRMAIIFYILPRIEGGGEKSSDKLSFHT